MSKLIKNKNNFWNLPIIVSTCYHQMRIPYVIMFDMLGFYFDILGFYFDINFTKLM
jgi:hypothetical protein